MARGYRKYKKENLYNFINLLSYIIRQFFLPNPFINLFELGMAEVINWIFGGVLLPLAYVLTGTWYVSKKGEYWKGSLGFLINYSLLTVLILLISKFITDIYLVFGIFVLIYLCLCIVECKLLDRDIISF